MRRRGPAAARNSGARAALGRLLAFLDSDDLFVPEKLQRQLELLDADPGLALCHTDEIWLRVPDTLRVEFSGKLQAGVYAKDVILKVIGDNGADRANYMAVEFTGSAAALDSVL